MRIIYFLTGVVIFFNICSCAVYNSLSKAKNGNELIVRKKTRLSGDFNKLEILTRDINNAEIRVSISENMSCSIESDENILPMISTTIKDSILRIGYPSEYRPTHLVIELECKDLNRILLQGSCNLDLAGLKNSNLAIVSEGISSLNITGVTELFQLKSEGICSANLSELDASRAEITQEGVFYSKVKTNKGVSADLSGIGMFRYSGEKNHIDRNGPILLFGP